MTRFRTQTYREAAAWLPALLLASCGEAAVPQQGNFDAAPPDGKPDAPVVIDAAPPADACPCRARGMAGRLGFDSTAFPIGNGVGNASGCLAEVSDGQFSVDGELLGGGCVIENGPNEHHARLFQLGLEWDEVFPESGAVPDSLGFYCSWRAPLFDNGNRMLTYAACLLPAEAGTACAREAWTSYEVQTAPLATQQQVDLRVSCTDGVLVSGSCSPRSFNHKDVVVVRSGFAPEDRDTWLCSLVNRSETVASEAMAAAFCLHEYPLPAECGCCPSLADSIVLAQADEPLRSGINRLQVQCDEGQVMAVGNCMIDSPDVASVKDVNMFRVGFVPTPERPDGDVSTWGCSWYNPTSDTPRAVATAVCLPGE